MEEVFTKKEMIEFENRLVNKIIDFSIKAKQNDIDYQRYVLLWIKRIIKMLNTINGGPDLNSASQSNFFRSLNF
jgi:hypothetical protein